MQHSDLRLNLDVYTDKGMLPMAAAVERLPMFPLQLEDAPPCAYNPDFSGHSLTSAGVANRFGQSSEAPEIEKDMRADARVGTSGQTSEVGPSGRIR